MHSTLIAAIQFIHRANRSSLLLPPLTPALSLTDNISLEEPATSGHRELFSIPKENTKCLMLTHVSSLARQVLSLYKSHLNFS